jgi:hypothetical protein
MDSRVVEDRSQCVVFGPDDVGALVRDGAADALTACAGHIVTLVIARPCAITVGVTGGGEATWKVSAPRVASAG